MFILLLFLIVMVHCNTVKEAFSAGSATFLYRRVFCLYISCMHEASALTSRQYCYQSRLPQQQLRNSYCM